MKWYDPEGYDGPPSVERRLRLRSMSQPKRLRLPVRHSRRSLGLVPEAEVGSEFMNPVVNAEEWIEDLYELCNRQEIGPSIDLVISGMGWLLGRRELERCNTILGDLDTQRLLSATLLAVLKETFLERESLPSRERVYLQTQERFLTEMPPEKVDRLLARLR